MVCHRWQIIGKTKLELNPSVQLSLPHPASANGTAAELQSQTQHLQCCPACKTICYNTLKSNLYNNCQNVVICSSCFLYNLYKFVLVSCYIVYFCARNSCKYATVCITTNKFPAICGASVETGSVNPWFVSVTLGLPFQRLKCHRQWWHLAEGLAKNALQRWYESLLRCMSSLTFPHATMTIPNSIVPLFTTHFRTKEAVPFDLLLLHWTRIFSTLID